MDRRYCVCVALGAALLTARPGWSTTEADICPPAGECTLNGNVVIGADSTINLAGRALTLAAGAKVTATGTLTLAAGDVTIASGAKLTVDSIIATVLADGGTTGKCDVAGQLRATGLGVVYLACHGGHVVSGKVFTKGATIAMVRVLGEPVGTGGVQVSGIINTKGTAEQGGSITVIVDDDVDISGKLIVRGAGPTSYPGLVDVTSVFGNVTFSGKILAQGKSCSGQFCLISLVASSGSLTVADGSLINAKVKTDGVDVKLESNLDLTLGDKVKIFADSKTQGGDIGLNSQSGSILGDPELSARGSGPGGVGGEIGFCAGDTIELRADFPKKFAIDARGGREGSGGTITMVADGNIQIGFGLGFGGGKIWSGLDPEGVTEICGESLSMIAVNTVDFRPECTLGDCRNQQSNTADCFTANVGPFDLDSVCD